MRKQTTARHARSTVEDSYRVCFLINLGDVMVKHGEILGDSINIAAWLEAPPERLLDKALQLSPPGLWPIECPAAFKVGFGA